MKLFQFLFNPGRTIRFPRAIYRRKINQGGRLCVINIDTSAENSRLSAFTWLARIGPYYTHGEFDITPPFLSWHTRIDIGMETRGKFRIFPFDFLKIIFGPICRNCRLLGRCTRWCYVYIGILRDSESSPPPTVGIPSHDRHNERHRARSYFIFEGINGAAINSFPRAGYRIFVDKFGRAERSVWKHLIVSTDITHVSPLRQEIARDSLIEFRRIFHIEMCHPS